jgi:hypothetical protein
MPTDLESKLKEKYQFKSAGERRIADVLNKYGIDFKYESPVTVHDQQNNLRIWYPDFYLPEYSIYLEYNGVNGNLDYDIGKAKRESTYKRNGLEVINIGHHIQPCQLENYILNRIYGIQKLRYSKIKSRIYELRTGMSSRYH